MRFLYPTLDEVLALHDFLIERQGGSTGIRDKGLIQAALARPQSGYYPGLLEEAAALWESLWQYHPFVDGNKRVALATTDVFLRMNGTAIRVRSREAHGLMIQLLEDGRFNFDELLKLLQDWTS
ncbi:MAG: type II toxin-antitoxin system death-on-curing family toxin [Chthonomonas sp.]|nr:type II toxin-antitoxin system death-on-curing family toxin [Chthonomonas sp.]